MKEKILLIGGSSKVGESIIKIINKSKYNIFSTYNKKKLKFKGIYQVKLDLESKSDRDKFSDKYRDMNAPKGLKNLRLNNIMLDYILL